MEAKIQTLPETILIGMRLTMCVSQDKTRELWQTFMPQRHQIQHRVNPQQYYSVRRYTNILEFNKFTPDTLFEKWAAVKVSHSETIPEHMEKLVLTGGKYAIFIHKGPVHTFVKTLTYIFNNWLPHSPYQLDHRAHFEILGENYQPNDPHAEEEVWVPIK